MLVRCLVNQYPLTGDRFLDSGWWRSIEPGKEYAVLAMGITRGELWFLVDANGAPEAAPVAYFEVVDGWVPDGWLFRHGLDWRDDRRSATPVFKAAEWGFPELVNDPGFWNAVYGESDGVAVESAARVFQANSVWRTAQEEVRRWFGDGQVEAFFWVCVSAVAHVEEVAAIADLEALAEGLGMTVTDSTSLISVPAELLAVVSARLVSSGLVEAGGYRHGFLPWELSPAGTAARVMESYGGPDDLDWGYSVFFRPSETLRAAAKVVAGAMMPLARLEPGE